MKLIVQPEHGIEPVLAAIDQAKKTIDIVIFRLNIKDVADALERAVKRSVAVRALIAHTNKGGEKSLRKLEIRLLGAGVTVSRTSDDFLRYHSKMLIVDNKYLHVYGFNFTWLDVAKSRSFGAVTSVSSLVKEAAKLFQADTDRQEYAATSKRLIVSPQNSRTRLAEFLHGAKSQLWIYDPDADDPRLTRIVASKQAAGVDVRIIGRVGRHSGLKAAKCPVKRLHIRAIIRDGKQAFIGSQGLRSRELDRRREVGVIITETPAVRALVKVFEDDWTKASSGEKSDQLEDKAAVKAVKAVAVAS